MKHPTLAYIRTWNEKHSGVKYGQKVSVSGVKGVISYIVNMGVEGWYVSLDNSDVFTKVTDLD